MLFQLLIVLIELSELVRQDISVRNEVKMLLAKPLLHPHNIEAKSIFPCNFMTLWVMVDLLVLVETFIQVTLTTGRAPKYVPFMGFSSGEATGLED